MKKFFYTLTTLTFLTIFALTFTACGQTDDAPAAGGTTGTTGTTDTGAGGTAATPADGVPTVTIGVQSTINVEDFNTQWMTTYIEETLGVDLNFDVFPALLTEAMTQFTLRVTAGQTLPDVVMFDHFTDMQITEFARLGVIIPLTDFYNDPQIAPNINAMAAADRDFMMSNLRMADGHIYSIPRWYQFHWNEGSHRMWINQDWLDNLGLDMPNTTEDLYNVLTAFVHDDPNGDGSNTIGLVGAVDGWNVSPIPFIMNAFINANPDQNWMNLDSNGQIFFVYERPEWVEGLRFMNRLFNSGLLASETFTQSGSDLTSMAQSPNPIAGIIPAGSFGMFGNVGIAAERTNLMRPLYGPEGVNYVAFNRTLPNQMWFITRDAQYPEMAFRIGDHLQSDYMSSVSQFGIHGVHWTDDPAEMQNWVGQYIDPPTFAVFPENPVWGVPGNIIWQNAPRFERWEYRIGRAFVRIEDVDTTPFVNWQGYHLQYYQPRFPDMNTIVGRLLYTAEELEELSIVQVGVSEHLTAMNAAFITGQRSLDEFDTFLAELESLGLSRWRELAQGAWDRR
ncbi:MAG: extracellular solute-binding protein [Defluviitaleaceae bacterium]|nr:extracellular solute-binding protein [Defluviitaleaceae bacterium]